MALRADGGTKRPSGRIVAACPKSRKCDACLAIAASYRCAGLGTNATIFPIFFWAIKGIIPGEMTSSHKA